MQGIRTVYSTTWEENTRKATNPVSQVHSTSFMRHRQHDWPGQAVWIGTGSLWLEEARSRLLCSRPMMMMILNSFILWDCSIWTPPIRKSIASVLILFPSTIDWYFLMLIFSSYQLVILFPLCSGPSYTLAIELSDESDGRQRKLDHSEKHSTIRVQM